MIIAISCNEELITPQYFPHCSQRKPQSERNEFSRLFAPSLCRAFLKSEKSTNKHIFNAEIYRSHFAHLAKEHKITDIVCIFRCFVILRLFGYMVESTAEMEVQTIGFFNT